jgi:glucose-fructose oxidoreductase
MPFRRRWLRRLALSSAFVLPALLLSAPRVRAQSPEHIRVAIIGLEHGHVAGFLPMLQRHPEAELVGIADADTALCDRYEKHFHLDHSIFYTSPDAMLEKTHPDAVLVYTSVGGHRAAIEAAARHNISVMVEKPLTTSLADAIAIRRVAREHHIHVLVNYETTWYASNAAVYQQIQDGKLGQIRKVVVHDGHEGPKEIGVQPEFFKWLTDPVQNGAGAMFDFGCYGADLMTWFMHGQAPTSVTAVAQTDKPDIYPHVDDDATIILKYPKTQTVLMPSWDWSFARKDSEIYGTDGYLITVGLTGLRARYKGEKEETRVEAPPLKFPEDDSLHYFEGVLHGQVEPKGDLTSLDTNMVVMQILDAARESAKTGRTVILKPLPE